MTNKQERNREKFYCSIIEFEQDFFPRSFSEKLTKKPTDNQSIGINLAKESFRKVREETTQKGIPEED